jgi:hypothetical protein
MATLPLDEQGVVTLDGTGSGFVALGPAYSYQTWIPTQLNVQVSPSPLNEPTFKYYRGTSGPTSFLGGTYTGSNDSTDIRGLTLHPGEKIFGVWTGTGTAGGVASMSIQGTKEIP